MVEHKKYTWPADNGFFPLATRPPSLAPGTYQVLYYTFNEESLLASHAKCVFSYEHSAALVGSLQKQIELFADDGSSDDQTAESSRSARVRSAAAAAAAVMDSEAPDDEELDEEEDGSTEGITMDAEAEGAARRALERDQLEALQDARERRHLRFQLESQERTARLIRENVTNKDLADSQSLNGVMRREMVESQRIATLTTRRGYDELDRYRDANKGMREDFLANLSTLNKGVETAAQMLGLVMSKATEKLTTPPPPATDFTGLGQSAIEMTGRVLLALLTKGGGPPELPPKNGGTKNKQLSASAATDSVEAKVSPAAVAPGASASPTVTALASDEKPAAASQKPAHPALQKLAAKFAGMSELELARRVGSPQGWQQLIDEVSHELDGVLESSGKEARS